MSREEIREIQRPEAFGPPEGQPLHEEGAKGWLPRTCFKHGPPGRIGVELEFVVHAGGGRARHLPPDQLAQAHRNLQKQQFASRFTIEPGGQVELSSLPADSLREALHSLEQDLHTLTATLARDDGRLVGRGVDPLRCRAPRIAAGESLPEAWTRWVLDAPVMMVRRASGDWTAPAGLTFRDWLRGHPQLSAPTLDDLRRHLTTLFPPVRARGHLEVRYLDAQPGPFWRVPAAVVPMLLDDDRARQIAQQASEQTAGLWGEAATAGLVDPRFRTAARTLLEAAASALDRAGHAGLATLTHEYLDRKQHAQEDEPC